MGVGIASCHCSSTQTIGYRQPKQRRVFRVNPAKRYCVAGDGWHVAAVIANLAAGASARDTLRNSAPDLFSERVPLAGEWGN